MGGHEKIENNQFSCEPTDYENLSSAVILTFLYDSGEGQDFAQHAVVEDAATAIFDQAGVNLGQYLFEIWDHATSIPEYEIVTMEEWTGRDEDPSHSMAITLLSESIRRENPSIAKIESRRVSARELTNVQPNAVEEGERRGDRQSLSLEEYILNPGNIRPASHITDY